VVGGVLGWWRGRAARARREVVGIAITTVGVLAIGASDASFSGDALLGDALALAGAIAMALYLLVARELGDALAPFSFSALAAGIGALALAPAIAISALLGREIVMPDASALGWIALSALLPQVVGHSLLTRALRTATPTAVGLATCSEPVLSSVLAALLLSEVPAGAVIIGCVITLAGVLIGVPREARRPD
jgi:drug/metabolite transporter (DMT)-like permease